MQPRPEPTERSAHDGEHPKRSERNTGHPDRSARGAARSDERSELRDHTARRLRWWHWATLGSGLLLIASLAVLLLSPPSRPGARSSVQHRASLAETPPLLARVQQLLGVGAPPARPRLGSDSDGLASSRNALESSTDLALAPARAAGSALAAPLAAGTGNGAEPPAATSATSSMNAPADGDVVRDARVTGRVLDATGGPIGGAVLRVHFEGEAFERARRSGRLGVTPLPDAEWISDADGRFEGLAPSGGVMLAVSAEAYVEAHARARAPAHGVEVVLAPAARVGGRVQRGDGTPVSGASLRLRPRALTQAPIEGTSDAQGEFSIGGVPAGVIEVTASAAGLSAAREWLHLSLAEVPPPVVLTLKEAHSVQGVVREPGGEPCTKGVVRTGGRWQQSGDIDAEGRYRLDGLDTGVHELDVICFGVGTQTRPLHIGADSPPSIQLDCQLDAGLAASGSVKRKNGEPAAGVTIWPYGVAPPDGALAAPEAIVSPTGTLCNTDAAGEFRCDGLRAGWYRFEAGSPTGARAMSEPVQVSAESEPRVALVLPDAGEVRVRVTDPSSSSARGNRGRFTTGVFARGERPYPIAALDRGDHFAFEDLELGRYRVAVGMAATELGPSAADIELTQPGQIIELELRAPEPLAITGTVIDAAGEPLPDAWVDASIIQPGALMPFNFAEPVLTTADGTFQLGDLPPGRYALRASHPSGEAEALDIRAGQSGVRLSVQHHGSLSGTVTTPEDQPARDFSVLAFRQNLGQPLSLDGDNGTWHLPWLPPGDYQIVIMSPTGGVATRAQVKSDKETQLALKLDPELAGQAVLKAFRRQR